MRVKPDPNPAPRSASLWCRCCRTAERGMFSRHAVSTLSRCLRSRGGVRNAYHLKPTQPVASHSGLTFLTWQRYHGFASAGAPKSSPDSPVHVPDGISQSLSIEGVSGPESPALNGSADLESSATSSVGFDLSRDGNGEHVVEAAASTAVTVADGSTAWSDFLLIPATSFISNLHDATGLPWWITIAVATLSVRTMLLPMSVYTMRSASKTAAVQGDLKEMRDEIVTAMKSGNRPLAEKKQIEQREFMKAAGVSPGRALACQLIQFPVFVSFFVGIRKMAAADPTFAAGGIAWFVDLSSNDVTYGLPILAGLSLLAMTELGGDTGTKMTPTMRSAMRFLAFASVPMTSWMPSAVFCYWIPSNIYSVCLGGAMRSSSLKTRLGLAVDPASIAGSKAAARVAIETGLSAPKSLSGNQAAATYIRESTTGQPSKIESTIVKPALFKTRRKLLKKSRKS